MTALRLLVSFTSFITAFSSYSFLILGDWGGGDTKPAYQRNVKMVAQQMSKTAQQTKAKFVINTGDSFYWCGIKSTSDQQIAKDFTGPFAGMPNIPWFSVLGNHGYGWSSESQVEYSQVNPQWVMPSRYYTKRKLVDAATNTYVTFIMLDTSPCVKMYRETNKKNWDPCGSQMPTCSLSGGDDDFEGPCDFHQNIMKQSCDAQYSWFQQVLNNVPQSDWLIVVGHHPADEVNVKDFLGLLQKRGFSIYYNGHAHTLTQYTVDGSGAFVTSGAGSLVNTPDQNGALMQRKLAGDRTIVMNELADGSHEPLSGREVEVEAQYYGSDWYGRSYKSRYGASSSSSSASSSTYSSSSSSSKHVYSTVWNKKVAGFALSTFSSDFKTLKTQFISSSGTVLHTFTVTRTGKISSSSGGGWENLLGSIKDTFASLRSRLQAQA